MKPVSKVPSQPTKEADVTEPQPEIQEQIRRRAYELYQQRGGGDEHELDDWLQAEAEITQTNTKTVAA